MCVCVGGGGGGGGAGKKTECWWRVELHITEGGAMSNFLGSVIFS